MAFKESDVPQFDTVFGRNLLAEVPDFVAAPILVVTMADLWPKFRDALPGVDVYFVESMERQRLEADLDSASGAASIVGLGGGQAIDAAKYFAWRAGKPLFQFPTSLSVDAVFGHRAGVREDRLVRYVGWAVPETVYIDLDIIEAAPRELNLGGLGDVFCFFTGVMDWRYAAAQGKCEAKWPYDESLADISLAKAEAALAAMDDIRALNDRGIAVMVDALRWGGASFHAAGWNPRHIEGVEHFIFYALEAGTGKKFLHGQAVCLGLILGCMMHDQRTDELLAAVHSAGIDIRPEAMDITWDDVRTAMKGLQSFVRDEGLAYGIAHDFDVTDAFLDAAQAKIEGAYGAWTR
ncbi:iron-containing alcohol dehydrogenase [Bauldia sp.]|uniref:iron-containing alcohol dehydrogenase n=1 Tax=Bauldia sp. TaxID=2575872 RepID=UPI003BACA10B